MTGVDGLILNLQQNETSPLARDVLEMSEGELEKCVKDNFITSFYN